MVAGFLLVPELTLFNLRAIQDILMRSGDKLLTYAAPWMYGQLGMIRIA
jgi:hypothetical protein